jgi:hypothetical protein
MIIQLIDKQVYMRKEHELGTTTKVLPDKKRSRICYQLSF